MLIAKSPGEKPSYLLFGMDCRIPTEAAFLPPSQLQMCDVTDYREELTLALSSARHAAVTSVQQAQRRYKKQYDWNAKPLLTHVGDWVLVRFPVGKNRKLSHPWHGPFHVTEIKDPDVEVSNVYIPELWCTYQG